MFRSWLGFYNSHLKRLNWTREELVRRATVFAKDALGLPSAMPRIVAFTSSTLERKSSKSSSSFIAVCWSFHSALFAVRDKT